MIEIKGKKINPFTISRVISYVRYSKWDKHPLYWKYAIRKWHTLSALEKLKWYFAEIPLSRLESIYKYSKKYKRVESVVILKTCASSDFEFICKSRKEADNLKAEIEEKMETFFKDFSQGNDFHV